MPLFITESQKAVTPEDVKALTGVQPDDLFADEESEEKLDQLLESWITNIESHVYIRIGKSIKETDDEFHAIRDIVIRTVAKVVAIAQQQRTSPVVQMGDFAISILNTSEVTKNLDEELKPFKKQTAKISIFSSSGKGGSL